MMYKYNPDRAYFDSHGNRIKLDTRYLEKFANKEERKEERKRKVGATWAVIRFFLCVFCGAFAFWGCDVFIFYLPQIFKAVGVMACIVFIASCVHDFCVWLNER